MPDRIIRVTSNKAMSPRERLRFILKQLKEYRGLLSQCNRIKTYVFGLTKFFESEQIYALSVTFDLSDDKPIDETQQKEYMKKIDENEKYCEELLCVFKLVEHHINRKSKTYSSRQKELEVEYLKLANNSCATKKRKRDGDDCDTNSIVYQTQTQIQTSAVQNALSTNKIKQEILLNSLIAKHKETVKSLETIQLFMFNYITIIHMLSQDEKYIKSKCSMLISIEKIFIEVISFTLNKMAFSIRHFEKEFSINQNKRYDPIIPPYEPLDIYQLYYVYKRTVPLVPVIPSIVDLPPPCPQTPEISYFDDENNVPII